MKNNKTKDPVDSLDITKSIPEQETQFKEIKAAEFSNRMFDNLEITPSALKVNDEVNVEIVLSEKIIYYMKYFLLSYKQESTFVATCIDVYNDKDKKYLYFDYPYIPEQVVSGGEAVITPKGLMDAKNYFDSVKKELFAISEDDFEVIEEDRADILFHFHTHPGNSCEPSGVDHTAYKDFISRGNSPYVFAIGARNGKVWMGLASPHTNKIHPDVKFSVSRPIDESIIKEIIEESKNKIFKQEMGEIVILQENHYNKNSFPFVNNFDEDWGLSYPVGQNPIPTQRNIVEPSQNDSSASRENIKYPTSNTVCALELSDAEGRSSFVLASYKNMAKLKSFISSREQKVKK